MTYIRIPSSGTDCASWSSRCCDNDEGDDSLVGLREFLGLQK